jgi:DNA mismatch repair ATPase MutS
MKIVFVTHFNELAEAYIGSPQNPIFLRAERLEDGTRTFKVLQAEPIPTSFGYDIFLRVFGKTDEFNELIN